YRLHHAYVKTAPIRALGTRALSTPHGKKPAPAPFGASKPTKAAKNPLFDARPKTFSIGTKVILSQRLKVPPALAQFSHTIDKNTSIQLFKLLHKYRPERKQEKTARLTATATAVVGGKDSQKETKKPIYAKYGLNHVVALVEAKKAALMGVPYVIVKGKARLGTVVRKKTAAVVAIQEVRSEDDRELATLIAAAKANFSDKYEEHRRVWGGGIRGNKSADMLRKRAKAAGQAITAAAAKKL
ncbi:hypothetical protein BC827DRAFT_1192628, partial [Russula dissimulans]